MQRSAIRVTITIPPPGAAESHVKLVVNISGGHYSCHAQAMVWQARSGWAGPVVTDHFGRHSQSRCSPHRRYPAAKMTRRP